MQLWYASYKKQTNGGLARPACWALGPSRCRFDHPLPHNFLLVSAVLVLHEFAWHSAGRALALPGAIQFRFFRWFARVGCVCLPSALTFSSLALALTESSLPRRVFAVRARVFVFCRWRSRPTLRLLMPHLRAV
jgi:hypothetical protein